MEWLLALLKSEWTAEDFIPTSQNQKLENHELVEVCQVVDSEEGELEEEGEESCPVLVLGVLSGPGFALYCCL